MSAPDSLFVRAARAQPTERTPVWFMRQAGRYMPEYRAIRKQYSLLEICKNPRIASQVTIEAAEILKVDAAIIFADLLLPLEVMGLPFHFSAGEGPKIEKPLRTPADIAALRTDRAADLGYVAEAVQLVCRHFGDNLPIIGFCGAPFTLASYMIEGGSSRNYLFTKKMMYSAPAAWSELMTKLVAVTTDTPPSKCAPAPMPYRFSIAGWAASAWKTIAVTFCLTCRTWSNACNKPACRLFTSVPTARLFYHPCRKAAPK